MPEEQTLCRASGQTFFREAAGTLYGFRLLSFHISSGCLQAAAFAIPFFPPAPGSNFSNLCLLTAFVRHNDISTPQTDNVP